MLPGFKYIIAGMLFICQSCLVQRPDDTPFRQTDYYRKTRQSITHYSVSPYTPDTLQVGWAKVSITPAQPVPLAGYGKRKGKKYTQVHDSVFVRAFVFQSGVRKAAFVTADLLIMPMSVTERLGQILPSHGYNLQNTYLTATHSHYSIGGWGKKPAGRVMAGKYSQRLVNYIADAISKAIIQAEANIAPARMKYQQISASEFVYNRLVGEQGATDGYIRLLQFRKDTGDKALLCTYTAHPTSITSQDLQLTAEYPGVLVKLLEQRLGFKMVAFGAGAVGSHGPRAPGAEYDKVNKLANGLAALVQKNLTDDSLQYQTELQSAHFPFFLNKAQWRLSDRWQIRSWLFYGVFGKYPAGISTLKLGSTVMVGTPCDFSGELVPELTAAANSQQLDLLVTSFNGGYIGYVTPERYFSLKKYETRDMNFFGRYTGTYMQEIIKYVILRIGT